MTRRCRFTVGCLAMIVAGASAAQVGEGTHDTSQHQGMVMNANATTLPRDCERIAAEHAFTIRAGTTYSARFPGTIFGYSERDLHVEPCSRVTVTFINEDEVRHQWMVHGLPRYLYPGGMFHLEANGGASQTGSFIVPSDARSYLVHCDLTQHMEKGMKAQLIVGRGSGDLWAVPGVSAGFNRDAYAPRGGIAWTLAGALAVAAAAGLWRWLRGRR